MNTDKKQLMLEMSNKKLKRELEWHNSIWNKVLSFVFLSIVIFLLRITSISEYELIQVIVYSLGTALIGTIAWIILGRVVRNIWSRINKDE